MDFLLFLQKIFPKRVKQALSFKPLNLDRVENKQFRAYFSSSVRCSFFETEHFRDINICRFLNVSLRSKATLSINYETGSYPVDVRIEKSWKEALSDQWNADYFKALSDFVRERYSSGTVFPPGSKIFAAFDLCPFDRVKVVILGQDPYHGVGQANGLCFSVNPGTALPPSLVNIFKEIADDTGHQSTAVGGDLSGWARQGVMLLNSILTVEASSPGSHQGRGWEQFTDSVIAKLSAERSGLVFMLWGSYAINKGRLIDRNRHLVLTSPHPSPLSAYRGFFGNRHFSRANEYLIAHQQTPIVW